MKKLFFMLAIAGLMTACKSKKADEKKADETTTTITTTTTTDPTTTTTTTTSDVPKFSDPDVQKFVDDYTAFVLSYKKGIVDPAQAQVLQKSAQEWATKMVPIGMKLVSNPEELKKWQAWATALGNEMKSATMK